MTDVPHEVASGPRPLSGYPAQGGAPVTAVTGAPPWRPLLTGEIQIRAMRLVELLVAELDPSRPVGADGSLSAGAAGSAVCHAMLARVSGDARAADRARELLDQAIDALGTQPLTSSLFAGFPGIAWAAEVVDQLLDEADEDRNAEIDEIVVDLVRRYPADDAPYDLIHGLTGLGVYALSRWPRAVAADCLTGLVDQFARRAQHDDDGLFWWTPPSLLLPVRRQMYPEGGVDLGVAHGIAGVIPLLARMHRLDIARETVGPLAEGAVAWLSAHLVETPTGPTVPYFIADGIEAGPARSAWCYGDPGVACTLLLAARDAERPAWADLGVMLATRAAARPAEEAGVTDAGLCHGSAGLAHLFNRMYQMTGVSELADGARFWVERTIDMCSAAIPADSRTPPEDAAPPWTGAGVLEGVAGIALALMAAGTATEPVWDPMLLVSTPQAAPGTRA